MLDAFLLMHVQQQTHDFATEVRSFMHSYFNSHFVSESGSKRNFGSCGGQNILR